MITALSPALSTRSEIIKALQEDPALIELGVSVYPGKLPNKPQRPFILVPTPQGRSTHHDGTAGGSDMSGVIHVFTERSQGVPDAEAAAGEINAHVVRILDGFDVVLDDVAVSVQPTLDQVIRDGSEADAWHGLVNYDASAT